MKILVIGDIIGDNGLKKAEEEIKKIKKQHKIDFIIANGENTAEGLGITKQTYTKMNNIGINVITLGNHTWAKKEIFNIINAPNLIRPANYPKGVPGKGYVIVECNEKKICVINLIGRTEMSVQAENPFLQADNILKNIQEKADIIIVDFHAEATAEKIAMGYHLDGKVNLVLGTHTHVQTADNQILEKGTAYITDIGMTGPKKSIIGMEVEASLKRFLTSIPERYKIANGESIFNGIILTINDEDCRTEKIERIFE